MNSFYTITNFRRYREKESYTFDGKVTFAKRALSLFVATCKCQVNHYETSPACVAMHWTVCSY